MGGVVVAEGVGVGVGDGDSDVDDSDVDVSDVDDSDVEVVSGCEVVRGCVDVVEEGMGEEDEEVSVEEEEGGSDEDEDAKGMEEVVGGSELVVGGSELVVGVSEDVVGGKLDVVGVSLVVGVSEDVVGVSEDVDGSSLVVDNSKDDVGGSEDDSELDSVETSLDRLLDTSDKLPTGALVLGMLLVSEVVTVGPVVALSVFVLESVLALSCELRSVTLDTPLVVSICVVCDVAFSAGAGPGGAGCPGGAAGTPGGGPAGCPAGTPATCLLALSMALVCVRKRLKSGMHADGCFFGDGLCKRGLVLV